MTPAHSLETISGIPMQISIELGRSRMSLAELLALRPGSVVALDEEAGADLTLLANGKPVAKGQAVVSNGRYGLRITEICSS